MLWTVLRRSATVWAGVLIAAVEVVLALGARISGLRLWADLVTGMSSASLFAGVIAAGFAAFEAGRWAPAARARWFDSVRPPQLVRLMHAGIAAVPIVAGFVCALVVLAIFAAATGTYGSPSPSWLLALGCALAAASGFGWIVGTIGRGRWWVAPAAALAFYALYVAVHSLPLPTGVQALYPVVLTQDFVFVRPVPATMLGMSAFSIGCVAVVLSLIGHGRRSTGARSGPTAAIVAGAVALLGASATLIGGGQYTEPYQPADSTCAPGTVRICVNPGYAVALPELQHRITALNERVAGTDLVADRLEQNIEGGPAPRAGTRSVHLEQFAGPDDVAFAVYRYVTEYGVTSTCRANGAYSSGLRAVADTWLSEFDAAPLSSDEQRALTRLRALSPQQANAWFRDHYARYRACTLTAAEMP